MSIHIFSCHLCFCSIELGVYNSEVNRNIKYTLCKIFSNFPTIGARCFLWGLIPNHGAMGYQVLWVFEIFVAVVD